MADTLGFIGLGVMGQPMAGHLARQAPLVVYNRHRERVEPLRTLGARVASLPRVVAEQASLVFLMLKDDRAVEAVVTGTDGLFAGLQPHSLVVDCSTISPQLTRRLAQEARALGAEWLDAPVTGGDVGAKRATLTIMVGGSTSGFVRARPWLEVLGERIMHVGPVGQGQTMKLVANLVSAMNLMAASEGLCLGLALGLDLALLAEVMPHSSAQSYELTKVLDRVTRQDFSPGFSVENRLKDLRLACEMAQNAHFPADMAEWAALRYAQHAASGYDEEDETSYVKHWSLGRETEG